ncbi:MAG: CHAT domain-containing protein [Acidobacteriota bacterium]
MSRAGRPASRRRAGCLRRLGSLLGLGLALGLVPGLLPPSVSRAEPAPIARPPSQEASAGSWLEHGRALARQQDLGPALDAFEQAEATAAAAGDRLGEGRAWLEQGIVLARSGAVERGAVLFERALARFEHLHAARPAAVTHLQLAGVAGWRNDPGAIEVHLEHAARLYRRAGDAAGAAQVAYRRSVFAAGAGDHEAAVRFGRQAATAFAALGAEHRRAEALRNVAYGLQHLAAGSDEVLLAEADTLYDQVLELAWEHGDQELLQNVYCNRAELERRRGDAATAEADLRRAIAGFEAVHQEAPVTPEEAASALEQQVAAYDRLILLLVDTGRVAEAFEVAERFRARSLRSMLAARRHGGLGESQLQREQERLAAALGAERLALESDLDSTSDDAARRIEELRLRLDSVRAAMRRTPDAAEPRAAGARVSRLEPVDSAAVRDGLAPDEALVSYWVSDERTVVWTLRRDAVHLTLLPIPRARLHAALDRYLESLRDAEHALGQALAGRDGEHLEVGRDLHRWLVEALPPAAHDAERWTLVLDERLHELPFEALVAGCDDASAVESDRLHAAYARCRFLGLERALRYAPSAGSLLDLELGRRDSARRDRGAFEDATDGPLALAPAASAQHAAVGRRVLSQSRDEVEALSAAFPGARAWVGDEATEARFRRAAPRHRILHLAAHGLIDDAWPASSGIVLAAGDGEDGLLTVAEVLALDLDADLVVLSACRSGRGPLSRVEGPLGLGRAFLAAGAGAVVVSSWDVDDGATAALMAAFYRALAAGLEPAEALRRARVELFTEWQETASVFRRREVALAHPRFWAGFVVVGRR